MALRLDQLRMWGTRHPGATDCLFAAVVAIALCVNVVIFDRAFGDDPSTEFNVALALAFGVIMAGALAWRRRAPLAVLVAVTAVYGVASLLDANEETYSGIALFAAIYAAGAYGRHPTSVWVRAVCISAMWALIAYSLVVEPISEEDLGGSAVAFQIFIVLINVFYFGAAWLMGSLMRSRRQREAELQQRTNDLEEAQAEIAGRAVSDERVRIARELHDVVAHHVSLMGVQAGAARRVLQRSPDQATEALGSIEASSRQAVDELHRLLGFLRQEGDTESTAPQPSLDQLSGLVEQMTEARLSVRLEVEGENRALPPGVGLSAYRVVQEALTNTLKHAGPGASATVTVAYQPDRIDVVVIDDGTGRPGPLSGTGNGHGNGLVGMRERVRLHHGELHTGARSDGGFEVRASFPVGNPA